MSYPQLHPAQLAELRRRVTTDPRYARIMQQSHYRYRARQLGTLIDEIARSMGLGDFTRSYFGTAGGGVGYNSGPNWAQIAALLAIPATAGTAASFIGPGAAAGGGSGAGAGGGSLAGSQALGMQGLPSAAGMSGLGAGAGAAGAGAGAGAGSAAGGSWWESLLGGSNENMDPLDWLRLALGGASMLGGAFGGQQEEPDMSPELRGMFEQNRARMESQNPLYESVTQLAFNRLPTSATAGLPMPSYADASAQVPAGEPGGNYQETDEMRNLLRQQQIRQRMSNPLFDAITRLAGQRMPRRP